MLKSENRKSSLFSSLKPRRSLTNLSNRGQKTTLIISGPIPQNQQPASASPNTLGALSPLDPNSYNKRFSLIYFAGTEDQENMHKRQPLGWSKHPTSPSSEFSFATLSAMHSDMASFESALFDFPLPTIMEHEEKGHALGLSQLTSTRNMTHAGALDPGVLSVPRRIHRTVNISDMRKFVEGEAMLPMNNRMSLEVEKHEIQTLWAKACKPDSEVECAPRLVENAFVMTFAFAPEQPRFWDEIDVDHVLKCDAMDSDPDEGAADLLPLDA